MSGAWAIETRYAGRRFRSRQEARWAVFFDALGIRWDYEPEGVVTLKGPYLPDFLLHLESGPLLYEVKPNTDQGSLDPRWQLAASYFKAPMAVAYGMQRPDRLDPCEEKSGTIQAAAPIWDNQYGWCTCPSCGAVGCTLNGRGGRVDDCFTDDKAYSYDDPRVIAAYTAAHSARFEHGESG